MVGRMLATQQSIQSSVTCSQSHHAAEILEECNGIANWKCWDLYKTEFPRAHEININNVWFMYQAATNASQGKNVITSSEVTHIIWE